MIHGDTDLVDDIEDGVEEHEVVLLEREVAGLLEREEHRPYEGDLGGAGGGERDVHESGTASERRMMSVLLMSE